MRRIAPASVSPSVLKHFAVLTLVITGGLAMFANGENRNALAGQVKQRQMQSAALRAKHDRETQHTVVIDGMRVAPGTRLENPVVGPEYEPYTNVVSEAPVVLADFPQASAAGPLPSAAAGPGMRDAKGAMVPPPPLNMRTRGKPGQAQAQSAARTSAPPPSEQDINAMIQASAQRAGRRPVE